MRSLCSRIPNVSCCRRRYTCAPWCASELCPCQTAWASWLVSSGATNYSLAESVQLRVLCKLRLHLRDIAAGSAPPLRPGCPELDVSVCFIDERGIAAAAGLTIGVSSCACLSSALVPAQQ